MKNTPAITTSNGQAVNGAANQEPNVQSVGELIRKAKQENPDAVKEPTTYPQPAPQTPEADPQTLEATPAPAPVMVTPVVPVLTRSRQEEIQFQVDKSRQMQLINTQLTSLTSKRDELKQFSYTVDENHDSRFGRIVIFDDQNREFICKNHGVAALVVEYLKTVFGDKIEQKENDLLTVSRS